MASASEEMRSVLVVAAHPDDETLGCGGTIARLAAQGATVRVAFLADGVSSRPADSSALSRDIESRRAAAKAACRQLGATKPSFGDFPDNRMDSVSLLEVTKAIEALVDTFKPDTVLTHHAGDLNIDHRRTHEAVATACRPRRDHVVRTLLCFEVPSSTEWQLSGSAPAFAPNWFMDISATLPAKLAALEHYTAELRAFPHPRSREAVTHLARWRGATVGVEAAEAFVVGRVIS